MTAYLDTLVVYGELGVQGGRQWTGACGLIHVRVR